MKKLTIAILAVILAIAVWQIGYYWKRQPVSNLDNGNNLPVEEKTSTSSPKAAVNDDLRGLSLKIIARPIVVGLNLSESSKNQAVGKIKELNDLIKQNYDYPEAWQDLGAYRRLIGDYEGAIAAWNFVGLIRPKNYVSYNNLGDLYAFYLKDYDKGEQNFLKSISNEPANINAYVQLATLYEDAYQSREKDAENILLLGINANPSVAGLKVLLGQYYERQGRKGDALKYFEEALQLDPNNKSLAQDISRLKGN